MKFIWMWAVMMLAMMLPSLTPVLIRLRRDGGARGDAMRLAGAYFFVWTIFGAIAYAIGAGVANAVMRRAWLSRTVPTLTGAALLLAGLVQLTKWKARRLTCCRTPPDCRMRRTGASRAGLRLGVQCVECCLAIMIFMLVAGVMELRVMLAATAIITLERVAPRPATVARITGTTMLVAGAYLLLRPGT
jgi:predicted metal-binding membrane protein